MGVFERLRRLLFGRPTTTPPPTTADGARSPKPPAAHPPIPEFTSGDFLPIARDELREAAKDVRLGGAWFGRRDLIPPAGDLRTKLIDRGMVTHGLLTPEQLVEI